MATQPKGPLGIFGKLPRELRDMVWEHFTPQWGSSPDKIELSFTDRGQKIPNNQAILRTSHELSDEVLPYLYKKEMLCFHVHGNWEQSIVISNSHGARWEYGSNGGDILQPFRELPYKRLKAIKIEIVAANVADPGQYICLWKRVRGLVDHLSQSGGLPQIEIHLVENPFLGERFSKWSYDGRLRRSINNIPSDINNRRTHLYSCDLDGILVPFSSLYSVPEAAIFVPKDFDRERNGRLLKPLEDMMKWQLGPFDDVLQLTRSTQRYLDNTYVVFEDSLDSLSGRTAALLRLHRYSTWYDSNGNGKSAYLEEMERLSSKVKIRLPKLKARYSAMLLCYPHSLVMLRIRQKLDLHPYLKFHTLGLENKWDERKFRRYYRPLYGFKRFNAQRLKERRHFKEVWMNYYGESGVPQFGVLNMFAPRTLKALGSKWGFAGFYERCEVNQFLL
jgi:hypothetical protein